MNSKFQIEKNDEGTEFHQIIIKNTITKEYISILPSLGARLNAAHLNSNGKLIPILQELNSADLKTNDELFNNAKLFPFAGRVRNGFYSFNNQSYQLPINYLDEKNACHGFVYHKKFNLTSENISMKSAEVELSYRSREGYDGYPFDFKINVTYKLSEEGQVNISTTIESLSSK